MRRVTQVYTPYLNDRENKDRIKIIDSSRNLNTTTVMLVASSAIVLNSIKIHDKIFGAAKEPSVDLIEDIAVIANALMFDVNEIICMDMEVVKGIVKAILTRLYPIPSISTTSELVLLLNNNSGISIEMVEDVSKNSYLSNDLFNAVSSLFNLVDRYNIEYTGDSEISCVNKL
jgi:hypothetical protein